MNSHLKIFAVVCAMALLIPAGATAKRPEGKPEKGNKHGTVRKAKRHAKEQKLKLASCEHEGRRRFERRNDDDRHRRTRRAGT